MTPSCGSYLPTIQWEKVWGVRARQEEVEDFLYHAQRNIKSLAIFIHRRSLGNVIRVLHCPSVQTVVGGCSPVYADPSLATLSSGVVD